MSEVRSAIARARTIVVKIGSSAVTDVETGIAHARLDALVDALEARMRAGSDVVVVSSGAVGAGLAPLRLRKRPSDLATKQAAASVGQLKLAQAWDASFARYGRTVGQVLLTADDVSNRAHHANAQRTLAKLRALHAVAVVNENDTVATNELRFGDNDRLGALVAHLTAADALLLLSDVDGLYTGDPRKPGPDGQPARLVPEVAGSADLDGVIAGTGGALGTGGMASKLSAARLAADSGVPVLLASAAHADRALADASVGTVFAAREHRMSARKFWMRHAAEALGTISLDAGAAEAVVGRRRSLLAPGITAVSGGFSSGDVVELLAPDGSVCARGVSSYDAEDIAAVLGRSSAELPPDFTRPVIHADDLVRT
ncbi:MAG: glutamate 5-kinase [Gordonia sp. (in: high G+C Gram-positive bacteria)]|uniref:glutamate 5-kinase n=1 Tax=Gordonia sp. (in: high G+C Gram-positive bacteria) TaxID=84139 RepID=UPI003BB54C46